MQKSKLKNRGKTRISLIDGEQLINLLIQNQVGVIQKEYIVPVLDDDFWTEVLGDGTAGKEDHPSGVTPKESKTGSISFPLPIKATHKGKAYSAELLGLNGRVRHEGVIYRTPTTAAKIIVTDWKEVNGWDFWRYFDPVRKECKGLAAYANSRLHILFSAQDLPRLVP